MEFQLIDIIINLFSILSDGIDNSGPLVKLKDQMNDEDSIISFNWDLLGDNLLGRLVYLREKKEYVKYIPTAYPTEDLKVQFSNLMATTGLAFGTAGNISVNPPYFEQTSNQGFLLKLHGSIDWKYCVNRGCRGYGYVFPVPDPVTKSWSCSDCHEILRTMIVPPILNKRIADSYSIRKIWRLAASEILRADHIIIWGYSLPPTDFYSRWLLSNMNESISLNGLTLINPNVINVSKESTINFQYIEKFYDLAKRVLPKDRVLIFSDIEDYQNNLPLQDKFPELKDSLSRWTKG